MVWPLLRPLFAVLAMIILLLSFAPVFFHVDTSAIHLYGITYFFIHAGNPAYVSVSFDELEAVLCQADDITDLALICDRKTSMEIAGEVYILMTTFALLILCIDVIQTLFEKTKCKKLEVFYMGPIFYTLGLVMYALISGVFTSITSSYGLGVLLASTGEVLMIIFGVTASLLERKKQKISLKSEMSEKLIDSKYADLQRAATENEP